MSPKQDKRTIAGLFFAPSSAEKNLNLRSSRSSGCFEDDDFGSVFTSTIAPKSPQRQSIDLQNQPRRSQNFQRQRTHSRIASMTLSIPSVTQTEDGPFMEWLKRLAMANVSQQLLDQVFYSGFMEKEGAAVKNWKRRFFELKLDALHYSKIKKSSGKQKYLGSIPLYNCQLVTVPQYKGRDLVLKIECISENGKEERSFFLQCESFSALQQWMAAIHSVRDKYVQLGLIEDTDLNDDRTERSTVRTTDDDDERTETANVESLDTSKELQLDYAVAAYNIITKPISARSLDEIAFVQALSQYLDDLKRHQDETNSEALPVFHLQSAQCLVHLNGLLWNDKGLTMENAVSRLSSQEQTILTIIKHEHEKRQRLLLGLTADAYARVHHQKLDDKGKQLLDRALRIVQYKHGFS